MDGLVWLIFASGVLARLPAPAHGALEPVPAGCAAAVVPLGCRAALAVALPGPGDPAGPEALSPAAPQRPRAVEHSDFYYARLTVHKIASLATVPLFGAEYYLGQKLYANPPGSEATRQWHSAVALGVAGLFAVNTVTGVWNLWDSRHEAEGRARRYIHAALMIAADAGFVATGATAPSPRRIRLGEPVDLGVHRRIAIISMGTALASYAMMLVWK